MSDSPSVIFDFIKSYIDQHGYPPSIREVCSGTGFTSTSTVQAHLRTLKAQGRINWIPSHPRTLTLIHGDA